MVTAPPESPVPAPRGTIGMRCLAATLTADATSFVLAGRTMASGSAPSMDASRSKMRRSLGESMTWSRPTMRRSSSITPAGSGMSGERCLAIRAAVESLEPARHRAGQPGRFDRLCADDQEAQPALALIVGWHAVHTLEDRLLDAAVGRHLDREPHRKAIVGDRVVGLVDLPVDRQLHRLCLCGCTK